MVNYNPETVSTDYDMCDHLYFDEISFEVSPRSRFGENFGQSCAHFRVFHIFSALQGRDGYLQPGTAGGDHPVHGRAAAE